jgi:hypothetical protein
MAEHAAIRKADSFRSAGASAMQPHLWSDRRVARDAVAPLFLADRWPSPVRPTGKSGQFLVRTHVRFLRGVSVIHGAMSGGLDSRLAQLPAALPRHPQCAEGDNERIPESRRPLAGCSGVCDGSSNTLSASILLQHTTNWRRRQAH